MNGGPHPATLRTKFEWRAASCYFEKLIEWWAASCYFENKI